jgi:colanic acid/amylovoran biosynthesis protein
MNILILNLHSALNLGDDAIMYETLQSLEKAFPLAKITIAANDPPSWRKYKNIQIVGSLTTWVAYLKNGRWHGRILVAPVYLGLLTIATLVYRLSRVKILFGSEEKRRLLVAYYTADLVLSCGGGNFYAHSRISPFFVWALLTLALAIGLGKKVVMLPQSIGPIAGRLQTLMARLVFNRVATIMLRETRSLDFVLSKLKIKKPVLVFPDLAFGLPPPPQLQWEADAILRIGVTVIDRAAQNGNFSRQQSYEETIESVLVKLNQEYRAHLYILAQCSGPDVAHDDRYVARRLYRRLKERNLPVVLLDTFRDALEIKAAYKYMDCLIGSRMHTGIFALSNSVPVVLIGYQPKAFGVMESFGLERYCCDIETVTAEQLYEMVRKVLENKEEIQQLVAKRYAETQMLLEKWTYYVKV